MNPSDLALLLFLAVPVGAGALFWSVVGRYRARPRAALLVLGNLALLAGLLAIALAGAEIHYRFVYDESDGFHLGRTSERWIERHYRYNNFGVRDDVDYADARQTGRTRITVLGDSFANGHGLAQIDDRFVNRLRRAEPGWEVHLLAADGLETGALHTLLEERIARGYQVDRVLYAYCLNDLSDLVSAWQARVAQAYAEKPGWLVENSWAVNTWHARLRALYDPRLAGYFDQLAQAYTSPVWSVQQARLVALEELVLRHRGTLRIVVFPFFEVVGEPRFAAIHEQIARFGQDRGVPLLDLREAFAGRQSRELIVNRYDAHPNARAHGLAADAILRFLRADQPPE